jgi:hypothetical protein
MVAIKGEGRVSRSASGSRGTGKESRLTARWSGWLAVAAGAILLLLGLGFAWKQPPHPDPWRITGAWDVRNPDWWRYPIERNAFKRLPVIHGDLRALHVSSKGGRKIWAAGDDGLIVHSPDGGTTWVQQHPRAISTEPPAKEKTAWNLLGRAWAAEPPKQAPVQQTLPPEQRVQQQIQQQVPQPEGSPGGDWLNALLASNPSPVGPFSSVGGEHACALSSSDDARPML